MYVCSHSYLDPNILCLVKCRTFTQISVSWPDTEQMREELDDLQVCCHVHMYACIFILKLIVLAWPWFT